MMMMVVVQMKTVLLSPQQWFMFVRTGVEEVQAAILYCAQPHLHLLLLRPRRVRPSSSHHPTGHQSGDGGTVTINDHSYRMDSVPAGDTAFCVVGHHGYQVRLCSCSNCNRVHFSHARFHLTHKQHNGYTYLYCGR